MLHFAALKTLRFSEKIPNEVSFTETFFKQAYIINYGIKMLDQLDEWNKYNHIKFKNWSKVL